MQVRNNAQVALPYLVRCCVFSLFAGAPVLIAQSSAAIVTAGLPEAPAPRAAQLTPSANASIAGTVLDTDGASVAGATIVLEDSRTHTRQTTRALEDGSFIFTSLAASVYRVTVTAEGFSPYLTTNVVTHVGETVQLPQIALEIASLNTSIDAITQYEMAEIEMKQEEKQRVPRRRPQLLRGL